MGEPILVQVDGVFLNVAGTQRGDLRLEFDHEPDNAEIVERVCGKISLPLLVTDDQREAHLTLCAFGGERDPAAQALPELRLLGGPSLHAHQRKVIKQLVSSSLIKPVGKALLKTLRFGEDQSFALATESGDRRLVTAVITHLGRFEAVAPSLKGHYGRMMAFVESNAQLKGLHPDAMLLLDYFVEDADYETERPFSLSLAVSFWPLKKEELPEEFSTAILHKEFLTDDDLRQFGLDPDEAARLSSLMEREWDRSLQLHREGDYEGVVKLWEPEFSNPLFKIDHPVWQDDAYARCRIHSVKSLLFIAHAQLAAGEEPLARAAAAFRLLQEVVKADPYSSAAAVPSGLPADWALVQNQNYVVTLNFATSWLDAWGVMLELAADGFAPEVEGERFSRAEIAAATSAVERRLAELKSILAE